MNTEEEAKKKWCPMVHDEHAARCIGSACMMWRWKGMEYVRGVTPGIGPTIHEYRDNSEARTLGYCGLAGRPEVA